MGKNKRGAARKAAERKESEIAAVFGEESAVDLAQLKRGEVLEGLETQYARYESLLDPTRRVSWDMRQQERMILKMDEIQASLEAKGGAMTVERLEAMLPQIDKLAMESSDLVTRQLAYNRARLIRDYITRARIYVEVSAFVGAVVGSFIL